jgi:hypothetical protein
MSLAIHPLGGYPAPVRDWTWQPASPEPVPAPAAQMEDDCCAGTAYGTDYQLADGTQPASMLTVWTYPVYAGQTGGFVLGRKYEYITYHDGADPATGAVLAAAGEDQAVYWDLGEAEQAAQKAAFALASGPRTERSDGYAAGFGWNGQTW